MTLVERRKNGTIAGIDAMPASPSRAMRENLARINTRYRLKKDGLYLHFAGATLTPVVAHAWFGSQLQMQKMRQRFPLAADCRPVEVVQK